MCQHSSMLLTKHRGNIPFVDMFATLKDYCNVTQVNDTKGGINADKES